MNQKHCNTCGTIKNAADFGLRAASRDGLASKCKACQSAYDKARDSSPERVSARSAYSKTDAGKAAKVRAQRRYRESAGGKESHERWEAVNPIKRAAHILVGNAIRSGRLTKEACSRCGESDAQAHHDDYAKPLDVTWLCPLCHKRRHKELAEAGIDPMNR